MPRYVVFGWTGIQNEYVTVVQQAIGAEAYESLSFTMTKDNARALYTELGRILNGEPNERDD